MGSVYSKERFPSDRIGFDVICQHMAVVMGVNLVINLAMQAIFKNGSWFKGLTSDGRSKRKRTVLYILSTVNAAIGAAYGVHHYATGSGHIQPHEVLVDRAYWCVVVVAGYIIQDLVMLLPEWKSNKQDIFHHLSVLFLGFVGTHTMPIIYEILPAFALQELSTPLLNLMWFGKEYKAIGDAIPAARVRQVFAVLFGIFRAVGFPLEFYLHRENIMTKTPALGYGIVVFCGLQYYWFYLIVRKAIKAAKGEKPKELKK